MSRCPAWQEFVKGRVQDGNCECYFVNRASGAVGGCHAWQEFVKGQVQEGKVSVML